jgi:hypothetical protein
MVTTVIPILSVFKLMRKCRIYWNRTVPEIIDPVFAKTSPKRSFCMTENERFGLVLVKTGSINSGTEVFGDGNMYCIFYLDPENSFLTYIHKQELRVSLLR